MSLELRRQLLFNTVVLVIAMTVLSCQERMHLFRIEDQIRELKHEH